MLINRRSLLRSSAALAGVGICRSNTPSFLIEFDDTQDNANHIHSVWRDFTSDFGEDMLQQHYRDNHQKK